MKRLMLIFFSLVIGIVSFEVVALDKPSKSSYDKRILYTDYKAGQVYPVYAANGIITTITFAPEERVLDYGSGYSTAWEFAGRGNHFFLKPKDFKGGTNLVVVTDRRTYQFDVKLGSRASATYSLTFRYPEDVARVVHENAVRDSVNKMLSAGGPEEDASSEKPSINCNYTENFGAAPNSKFIAPLEVYDDGEFTYMRFAKQTDFPSVYRVDEEEGETLLNAHVEKGDWLVIHGVYSRLMLRVGKAVVGIYNEAFTGGGRRSDSGVAVPGLERIIIEKE